MTCGRRRCRRRLQLPPPSALTSIPHAPLPAGPQQAAKLAEAVLKKYKGDQLVRALKGYALYRCGKAAEALQVCS